MRGSSNLTTAGGLSGGEFKRLEREYWDGRFAKESDVAQLQRMYERATSYDDSWGILDYMQRVVDTLPARAAVLEIGAGLGAQSIPLALHHGHAVIVTDIALQSLAANRAAAERISAGADLSYEVADADHLPFADNTFDLVLMHATLHHLPQPGVAVAEMIRCLKVGGLLVLGHEPNRRVFEPLRRIADRLRITERHTQRFLEGQYSVADEETPGFFRRELAGWMSEHRMRLEWLTPVWFANAFLYNLPVLTEILVGRRLEVPRGVQRAGKYVDTAVFAKLPGVRGLSLFWSLGARKSESFNAESQRRKEGAERAG